MSKKFESVQRVDFIKAACKGKKVLHLGCTNYPYTKQSIENEMLLHFELEKTASELYGFDFDQAGLDILIEADRKNLFRADLEKLASIKKYAIIKVMPIPDSIAIGIRKFARRSGNKFGF